MPTCMQVGQSRGNTLPGYLDYLTLGEAEKAGAFDLRQSIKILPNLFDVGLHEYANLVKDGHVDPACITHFLCHYSSERFKPMMVELMQKAVLQSIAKSGFLIYQPKAIQARHPSLLCWMNYLKPSCNHLKWAIKFLGLYQNQADLQWRIF